MAVHHPVYHYPRFEKKIALFLEDFFMSRVYTEMCTKQYKLICEGKSLLERDVGRAWLSEEGWPGLGVLILGLIVASILKYGLLPRMRE